MRTLSLGLGGVAALSVPASLCLSLGCVGTPPPRTAQGSVTVCPTGSYWDLAAQACLAPPVEVATGTQKLPLEPAPPLEPARPGKPEGSSASPAPTLVPVEVTCAFSKGWVTVMPAEDYPKDDQWLMQALIGFTDDSAFWDKQQEFQPLKKYAAQPCTGTAVRFLVPAGDAIVLGGQAGTFKSRNAYKNNGLRRQISLSSSTRIDLRASDLTHTWLCISCPWVSFEGDYGRGPSPFVILAHRDSSGKRGRELRRVSGVPVHGGRVVVTVSEREDEETHLDELVLLVRDREGQEHRVVPLSGGQNSSLAATDGIEVRMKKGSTITVTYDVGSWLPDGPADLGLVSSGWYAPQSTASR